MKRKRTITVIMLSAAFAALVSLLSTPAAYAAQNLTISQGASSARGVDQATDLFGSAGIFTTVSNVMLFVVGAISVSMIIIGGLRDVTSGGNTANVTAAKNTILYAIVGVVVSLFAYAMINFVLTSFIPNIQGGSSTNV